MATTTTFNGKKVHQGMIKSQKTRVGDFIIAFIIFLTMMICLLPMVNVLASSLSSSEHLIRNDVVSLTNADNFSEFDKEDLAVLKEKGTRAVYFVDYASRSAEFADLTALGTYLDKVVARTRELGLDGLSFSGIPVFGSDTEQAAQKAVAALFMEKFAAVAGPGKELLLLFEGAPQFLAAADRAKVDYFVLDTKETDNATDLKLQVLRALNAGNVPSDRLLLGAMTEYEFTDEDKGTSDAVAALTMRIPEIGGQPLAGLCVYNVNADYFGADFIYPLTRTAIQTLNPSK